MLFSLYREHASAAGFSLVAAPPCSSPNYHQQLQPHNPGYLVPAWTPYLGSWAPCSLLPTGHLQGLPLPFAKFKMSAQGRGLGVLYKVEQGPARWLSSLSTAAGWGCILTLWWLFLFSSGKPTFSQNHRFHTPPRPPSAAGTWSWWSPCSIRHWVQTKQYNNIGYSRFMECCWLENKSNSHLCLWCAPPQMWELKNKVTTLNKHTLRCKMQAPSQNL